MRKESRIKSGWRLTTIEDNNNALRNIWNNNGTYWLHYTIRKGNKFKRIRRSLKTNCIFTAMRIRDEFLNSLKKGK